MKPLPLPQNRFQNHPPSHRNLESKYQPTAKLVYEKLGRMKKMSLKLDSEELKSDSKKTTISKTKAFLMKPTKLTSEPKKEPPSRIKNFPPDFFS